MIDNGQVRLYFYSSVLMARVTSVRFFPATSRSYKFFFFFTDLLVFAEIMCDNWCLIVIHRGLKICCRRHGNFYWTQNVVMLKRLADSDWGQVDLLL